MGKKKKTTIIWPTLQQKRPREESSSPRQASTQEAQLGSFDVWLKDKLKSRGVEDLFEDISSEVDKERKKLSADIKRMVVTECQRQKDINESRKSILIQNVESLVEDIGSTESRISLVDQVTRFLHDICNGTVSVIDAYTLDRRTEQQSQKTICVVLGSIRQKATCFRALLAFIKSKTATSRTNNISLRDVFPKERMTDVKKLVEQGLALKKEGKIARFKVRSRGQDAIPILEVRKWTDDQQRGVWQVFVEESGTTSESAKVTEDNTGCIDSEISPVTDLLMDPHAEVMKMVATTQSNQATEGLLPVVSEDQPTLSDSSSTNIEVSDDSESFYELPTNIRNLPQSIQDWKVKAKTAPKNPFAQKKRGRPPKKVKK
jgi:hypothetical protein